MLTKHLEDKKDHITAYYDKYYDPDLRLLYEIKDVDGDLCYNRCYALGFRNYASKPLPIDDARILRLRMSVPNGIRDGYLNVSHDIDHPFDPQDLLAFFNPGNDLVELTRFLKNVLIKDPNEYVLVVHNASDEFINYMNVFTWHLYGIAKILSDFPVYQERIPEWVDLTNRIKHFTLIAPYNTLGVFYEPDPNALSTEFKQLPTVGSTMIISREKVSKFPSLVGNHKVISLT